MISEQQRGVLQGTKRVIGPLLSPFASKSQYEDARPARLNVTQRYDSSSQLSRSARVHEGQSASSSSSREELGSLSKLPSEIRTIIYDFVVIYPRPVYPRPSLGDFSPTIQVWPPTIGQGPAQPNLTRTCRQIRKESLPIFYGSNTFSILRLDWQDFDPDAPARYPLSKLDQWFKLIGQCNRHLIKTVFIPGQDGKTYFNSDTIEQHFQETWPGEDFGAMFDEVTICGWDTKSPERECKVYKLVFQNTLAGIAQTFKG